VAPKSPRLQLLKSNITLCKTFFINLPICSYSIARLHLLPISIRILEEITKMSRDSVYTICNRQHGHYALSLTGKKMPIFGNSNLTSILGRVIVFRKRALFFSPLDGSIRLKLPRFLHQTFPRKGFWSSVIVNGTYAENRYSSWSVMGMPSRLFWFQR